MIFMTDFKKMDIVYELVLFMYHPSGWDSKYTRVYKIPGPILLFLKFGLPGVYWLGFRLRACRPKLGAVDANGPTPPRPLGDSLLDIFL